MFSTELKALCVLACLQFCATSLHAQTVTDPADTDRRHFSFGLPEGGIPTGADVTVELDGYDVSAFARVDSGMVYLELDAPLAVGSHELAILLFLPDGDIETLLSQPLEVSGEEQSSWHINATFNSSYRVAEKEKADFTWVPHLAGTGAVDAASSSRSGNWQVDTQLQAAYDSVSQNNIDDDEWALADYKVAATYHGEHARAGVAAGNLMIERNDLLFSAFQRRGVSAEVADKSNDYQLKVFSLQSDPTTRYDGDHLVADESYERSVGATGSFALAGDKLVLSAGFVDGEGTLGGAGFNYYGDPTIYGGETWNVALDSYWLTRSLWLHGEYAESDFDSDGIHIGEAADTDSAAQAIIKLSSDGDLGSGIFDYWSALAHYQKVGAQFFSIANLTLPGNQEMQRLFLQGAVRGLAADIEWAEEENNVDDDPFMPTQTLKRQNIALNYTPMNLNPDRWVWQLLGTPMFSAGYLRSENSQPLSDAALFGYDLDNLTKQSSLGAQFQKDRYNWGINRQITIFEDNSRELYDFGYLIYEPTADTRNTLTELQIGWRPVDAVSINLYSQWNKLAETGTGNIYRNQNYGVDGVFQLVPDTLTLSLNYNQVRDRSQFGNDLYLEDDFRTDTGNAQLSWRALQPSQLKPGIDFYLRGSYGKQDNRTFAETDESWTAHIGVEIQWSALGGQS